MKEKVILLLIMAVFMFVSCDGTSIKSTKPKTDLDNISQNDGENDEENNDNENDDSVKNDNLKPDEDNVVNAVCGDGFVEGNEVCEKENVINCVEINEKLYEGGKAKCLEDCSAWDTLTCDEVPMECGNNIVEGIEVCDNNTIECHDLNPEKYESGTATCGLKCDSWNESNCVTYKPAVCGDGTVTGKEVCEKEDVTDCVDINAVLFESGKAKCLENCTGWDTETCIEREVPDDDTIVCADECSKINSVRCEGPLVMKCDYSGGCLKWVEVTDCLDTSRLCIDGNTVGFGNTATERSNVYRGNFIEATSDATIYEFAVDIDNVTGQPLIFAVYESDTSDGEYTPIATRTVDEPGTGRKMYSSGPIKKSGGVDVTVTAGKFYIFGVAWVESMNSYYYSYFSFVPHFTTFGKTLGGTALTDSYPLLPSISGAGKTQTNYNMYFNTGSTDTEICECDNKCSNEFDLQCTSNWIEECRADTYGCLDWHQDENCGNLVCTEDGSSADCLCDNECSSTTQKRCNMNWVEKCGIDSDGCFEWQQETNCGTMVCSGSSSPVQCVCDNECTYGHKECDGSNVMVCEEDINSCTYWDLEFDCSTSMIEPYCGKDGETSAKCYEVPQSVTDYIAKEADVFYNASTTQFKGMFIEADSNAVITGFKVHLQQPGGETGVSVLFMIYENSTLSGAYTRRHLSGHTVGANGYYGPTGINVSVTKGNYYFIGFYVPANTGYYYTQGSTSAIEYDLNFGKSIGGKSTSTSTEPGSTYSLDSPSSFSYRMWIENYLN